MKDDGKGPDVSAGADTEYLPPAAGGSVRLMAIDAQHAAHLKGLLTQGHAVPVEIVIGGGARRLLIVAPDPRRERLDRLSPQEIRVLEHVAAGRTNKEIASILRLSHKTVKNYLSNAFQKLQVRRRSRAAAIFIRRSQD